MIAEPFHLERRTQAQIVSKTSTIFLSWSDVLAAYGSKSISAAWPHMYSKSEAIQDLLLALRNAAPNSGQEDLLRALLTDRGLLFPQTRERWYGDHVERSMRLSLSRGTTSRYNASLQSYEAEPILNRLLRFGAETYDARQFNFEGDYPFISREKTLDGIRTLVENRSGPFCLLETDSLFSIGRCTAELGKLTYLKDASEMEYNMSRYLETLQFHYNDSEWISFSNLKRLLPFSTVEFYEFFAYIFPSCLHKESIYQEQVQEGCGYIPSLNAGQKDAFDEQVKAYNNEHLTCWMNAYSVLDQYLFPDFSLFEDIDVNGEVEDSQKDCSSKLEKAIKEYYNRMEPFSHRRRSKGHNASQRTASIHSAAVAFLSATLPSGSPVFWTRPHIIFCLVRSPRHRYWYNYESRRWKLSQVIDDAYYQYPLPITCQSLQSDRVLFLKIVNICADICKKGNLAFPKDERRELWECIQQSTECLSFHKDDMNSARYRFHALYKCSPNGFPILDHWLDKRLSSTDAPVYIALWRTLINKFLNLPAGPGELLAAFNDYQSHFKDPAFDEDLESFFTPLCSKIDWSKIPLSPTDEEIEAACKALKQNVSPEES